MKQIKHIIGASLAALLLASCGGGGGSASSNPVGFTQVASFGDSLSDAGSFAVGSVALLGGGRYTINSGDQAAPSKIWLDLISTQLSLPAPCAAVKGLTSRAPFGAPVARTTQAGCNNYAQGGSRVINPIGPANSALPDAAGGAVGQLTEPVTTQISNYLAANGGAFGAKKLVTVLAGGNDIFMNGNAVSSAAGGGAGAVGAAVIAGWSNGMDALAGTLAAGGTTATNAAIAQAITTMSQAGTTLATQIKTEIVGKGAKYVLVLNLPDVSSSPYGIENPTAAPLVNQMVQAFNASLTAGLSGVSGVVIGDAYTTSRDQFTNPAAYAASNSTSRACKRAPDNVLDGAALICNPTNVIAGDISKYLFADDVHPTPYGHQLLAQFAAKVLASAGWL
jgi:outer membrane lipase/esterase